MVYPPVELKPFWRRWEQPFIGSEKYGKVLLIKWVCNPLCGQFSEERRFFSVWDINKENIDLFMKQKKHVTYHLALKFIAEISQNEITLPDTVVLM